MSNSSFSTFNIISCNDLTVKDKNYKLSEKATSIVDGKKEIKITKNFIKENSNFNSSNEILNRNSIPNTIRKLSNEENFNLNFDNVNRLNKLIAFMETHHLSDDVTFLSKQREVMLIQK